jgi:hypothetical protein
MAYDNFVIDITDNIGSLQCTSNIPTEKRTTTGARESVWYPSVTLTAPCPSTIRSSYLLVRSLSRFLKCYSQRISIPPNFCSRTTHLTADPQPFVQTDPRPISQHLPRFPNTHIPTPTAFPHNSPTEHALRASHPVHPLRRIAHPPRQPFRNRDLKLGHMSKLLPNR